MHYVWWERTHFLVHRQAPCCVLTSRGSKRALWGSFCRHTTSIVRASPHDLMTSQRHYFLILSHWGVGFPCVFEKDTHVQPLQLKKRLKYSAFSLSFERPEIGIVNCTEWDSVWLGRQDLKFESEDLGSFLSISSWFCHLGHGNISGPTFFSL